MFCKECGKYIENHDVCPYCGWGSGDDFLEYQPAKQWNEEKQQAGSDKSRVIAGVLQIFTGALGLGRFYLGYKDIALLQILVSFASAGFGGFIWGVIDGVMILSGIIEKDGKGNTLIM